MKKDIHIFLFLDTANDGHFYIALNIFPPKQKIPVNFPIFVFSATFDREHTALLHKICSSLKMWFLWSCPASAHAPASTFNS